MAPGVNAFLSRAKELKYSQTFSPTTSADYLQTHEVSSTSFCDINTLCSVDFNNLRQPQPQLQSQLLPLPQLQQQKEQQPIQTQQKTTTKKSTIKTHSKQKVSLKGQERYLTTLSNHVKDSQSFSKSKETNKFGKVRGRTKCVINEPVSCSMCKRNIESRNLLHALDKYWHEKCLKCDFCRKPLHKFGDRFYFRQGAKFCHEDFIRTFGERGVCCLCDKVVPPSEYVLRFKGDLVYHLDCFKCIYCRTRFCVGDPVTISDPKHIVCSRCRHIPQDVLLDLYHKKYDQVSYH